jgi:hypothetical protein
VTAATDNPTINFDGTVASFSNLSGGVISNTDTTGGRALNFNGLVTSFNNASGATIDSYRNGVSFQGGVTNGVNDGVITSRAATGETGVRGGSVRLNSYLGMAKWISALVMLLPGLASAG